MVTYTNDFIGQGIVIASILAGFAFTITAQIALGGDRESGVLRSALLFIGAGVCSLVGVVSGLLYHLGNTNSIREFFALLMRSVLAISLLCFVDGLRNLLEAN